MRARDMSQYARSSAMSPSSSITKISTASMIIVVGASRAAQRHVDLEHHRGLIRADDHVARNELDRIGHRVRLVPERADALVADVRRLADRVVPLGVGGEQIEARLLVVAPVRVDVGVDDRSDALRGDHALGVGADRSFEAS